MFIYLYIYIFRYLAQYYNPNIFISSNDTLSILFPFFLIYDIVCRKVSAKSSNFLLEFKKFNNFSVFLI